MVARDALGNFVEEGGVVSLAMALGQFALGKVEKITAGLDGSQPTCAVVTTLYLPIHPNGLVQGVLAVKTPEPPSEQKVIEG